MTKRGLGVLVIAAAIGLVACGGGKEAAAPETTTVETTIATTEAVTETSTESIAETEAEIDKTAPLNYTNSEGNVLSFTKYEMVKDFEGKPAVAVFFNYTNNGDEAKTAMFDFGVKTFQDGIECNTAILSKSPDEVGNSMKEIKKGVTIPVCFAYSLSNTTSDIELEVSDLISFGDDMATQIIQISDGTTESNAQEAESQAETQAALDGVVNFIDSEGSSLVYTKHEVSKDYQGKPALLVYFDYTNNSDASKAAMTSYMVKAFQNGIECGTGISTTAPAEYQNSLKEIKKGAKLSVCWQFALSDDSDVDIEVGTLFGGAGAKQTISLK